MTVSAVQDRTGAPPRGRPRYGRRGSSHGSNGCRRSRNRSRGRGAEARRSTPRRGGSRRPPGRRPAARCTRAATGLPRRVAGFPSDGPRPALPRCPPACRDGAAATLLSSEPGEASSKARSRSSSSPRPPATFDEIQTPSSFSSAGVSAASIAPLTSPAARYRSNARTRLFLASRGCCRSVSIFPRRCSSRAIRGSVDRPDRSHASQARSTMASASSGMPWFMAWSAASWMPAK